MKDTSKEKKRKTGAKSVHLWQATGRCENARKNNALLPCSDKMPSEPSDTLA